MAAVLAFVASGCQVTLSAGIEVGADGSGTVHAGVGFDDEAVAEVGDLAAALRADDLRQAGWEVAGPAPEEDGLTWVRASKDFDDPEEAAAVAAELSGPDGPFRDFRVTRERSLLRTKTSFSGVADLSRGLAGLSDAELQAALGDFDLGLDVDGLRRRFGDTLGDRVRVQVSATLPGKVEANTATVGGGRAQWTPAVGERIELTAEGDLRRLAPLVWGSLALVVVAGGLAVVGLRARVRRRKGRAQR
jgi:hypothetical protein